MSLLFQLKVLFSRYARLLALRLAHGAAGRHSHPEARAEATWRPCPGAYALLVDLHSKR